MDLKENGKSQISKIAKILSFFFFDRIWKKRIIKHSEPLRSKKVVLLSVKTQKQMLNLEKESSFSSSKVLTYMRIVLEVLTTIPDAPAAAAPAKKEESEEEEDDDMGFGLFD